MKQCTLVLMAAMAMVGCGEKATLPESASKQKIATNQPESSKNETKQQTPTTDIHIGPSKGPIIRRGLIEVEVPAALEPKIPTNAFINTLGMPFVKVPELDVQFCIWETRVKDYVVYAAANAEADDEWKGLLYYRGASFKQPDTHPVVNVNWKDAKAFCVWLTDKELAEGKIKPGQKYRLPTDAEWSMAVGVGNEKGKTPAEKNLIFKSLFDKEFKSVYPWGTEWPPQEGVGNYGDINYGTKDPSNNITDRFGFTSPVGSFAANKLGLYDMGGNVWEWCEDLYDPAEKEFPDRVFRGASWADKDSGTLLSSARNGFFSTSYRISFIGFRCVLARE